MAEIKNLKKAAKRIKKAVLGNEKIIIFADADLDGTTSAIILEETILNLAGKTCLVFFPNREIDGYGLSEEALERFKNQAPGLLIVLDCGIGNFIGVKQASLAGFSVIIIDHHEILGKLPSPALIVDPKQPKDKYIFKKLANVSLVYMLSQEIFSKDKLSSGKNFPPTIQKSFLELAALGAIADMMPEEDYNKKVIQEGSACLQETFRPGMKAMVNLVKAEGDNPRVIFSKIVTALNITDHQGNLTESYLLFKEKNFDRAFVLARKLIDQSQKRQTAITDIAQEVIKKDTIDKKIIFEGNELWEQVLTGPVASRVCNKTQKPSFIFKIGKEKCRGSVRMPHNLDAVLALKTCSAFLEVYGGHPPAAGFTCDKSQVEGLKKCLEEYFKQNF